MKKRNLLLSLGACALAIGTVAAAVNANETIETQATAAAADTMIYFNIENGGSNWSNYKANIFAYVFNGSETAKFIHTTTMTDDLYCFVLPQGYASFLFVATKDGVGSFDSKSAQTVDIAYGEFDFVKLTSESSVECVWSYHVYPEAGSIARSVANNTKRYWFASNDSGVWGSSAKLAAKIAGGTYNNKSYLLNYVDNGGSTGRDINALYYLDVPTDATHVDLLRICPTTDTWGNYIVWNSTYIDLSNAGWVSPYTFNWVNFESTTFKVSEGAYWGLTPSSLAVILQEFPTCTITAGEVESIFTNFIEHHTGSLASASLSADFARADYLEDDTYVGISQKNTVTPTVEEKWEALCERVGANVATGKVESISNVSFTYSNAGNSSIFALFGIFGAAALGSMVFLLKKKKEN